MPGTSATVPVRDGKSNPKLLDQVRDAIRRKLFSLRSEAKYSSTELNFWEFISFRLP
jgi:hypothetical protein